MIQLEVNKRLSERFPSTTREIFFKMRSDAEVVWFRASSDPSVNQNLKQSLGHVR